MGVLDEPRARAVLLEMQERLARDPYLALGLPPTATPAEARTAFLELTKTYHPARFGYMSTELQKLSNEVFLLLRAAHDAIARPVRLGKGDRSGVFYARSDRSGVFPGPPPRIDRGGAPMLASAHTPPSPLPAYRGQAAPPARVTPARLPSPPLSAEAAPRPTTPASGVRVDPARPAAGRPPGIGGPDERDLAIALEHMHRGQWDAARAILSALAARAPNVPRYRALIAYSRGREAQLSRRLDEARVELQDALQLDPELQLAKTALAELFTRRK